VTGGFFFLNCACVPTSGRIGEVWSWTYDSADLPDVAPERAVRASPRLRHWKDL
jgi:hypothetical protein